jgi:RND family efflux transporter MFP subunit
MMWQLTRQASVGFAALVALASSTAGCAPPPTASASQTKGSAAARVEVVRPERATIRRYTEEPGQIEAYEETALFAKVSGYVQQWNVDIGAKITKGQVLAVLSVPELDAEAEQKQAIVEESQAKLAQARAAEEVAQANLASTQAKLVEVQAGIKRSDADLARWQAEYKRVEQLHNERALTGSLLDETRSKLYASESARDEVYAQVKTAEAAVKQAAAMLDKARADVIAANATIKVARSDARRTQAFRDYTTIFAPYAGVVIRRHVNKGDLTEPGARSQPLFVVARDDVVRITVSVPEMYATTVNDGDPAKIHLQALAGKAFAGKVSRTSWIVDAKSRTLRTEIDLPNPEGILRPGLYAYATITVDEHQGVLTIPGTALVHAGAQTFCMAVLDGKIARKPVTVGLEDGTRAEIVAGLEGNETIVKANASSLVDGQPVQIAESAAK